MKILLATDGSEYSRQAVAYCGELATGLPSAIIKIITVIDNFTPMATEPFISPEEFLAGLEREMRETAAKVIDETEKILRPGNEKLAIESEILIGSAKKVIVEEAEKWGADLIIVGSHGYGFWGRALIGSVSDSIVHHSPCSVLIVRKQ